MILLISALLTAALGCTHGSEFEPPLCPAHLPAVAAVRIERQGFARWPRSDEPACTGFRLTDEDVRRFFRHARQADARDVHYTLPESACVARGTIRFVNGGSGRWQIDRFGLGWLDRAGQVGITLYCRSCRTHPWAQ
jgi:hypothetical protein